MFKSTIANAQKEVEVIKKDEGYYLMDLEKVGETINSGWLTNSTIELIEDQTIDIDSIDEFERNEAKEKIFKYTGEEGKKSNLYCFSLWASHELIDKINELVRAVKQNHKEIQSIKNKE